MFTMSKRDNEQYKRLTEEYDKVKYRCRCGHRVIIPNKIDKNICSWCGNYVFKNKKDEFEYRIKEKLQKGE